MDYTIRDPGKPIRLVLASRQVEDLEAVAADVREALLSYPGVFDVSDSFDSPRDELVLELKPAAETLGIGLADVARQVRQAFYGAEAQRIPRGREDVKVMVRYPEAERLAIANLNDMYIRTPGGGEVPFEAVATYRVEAGYQKLERLIVYERLKWRPMCRLMGHPRGLSCNQSSVTTCPSGSSNTPIYL